MGSNRKELPVISDETYREMTGKEPDKLFKGIWLGIEELTAINNGDISWLSGALFSLMKMFPEFKTSGMWASNGYLGTHFNVSEQTITNCLSELREYGFIETGIKQGSRNMKRRIKYNSKHKRSYVSNIRGLMFLIYSKRDSKRTSNKLEVNGDPKESPDDKFFEMKRTKYPQKRNPLIEYWNNFGVKPCRNSSTLIYQNTSKLFTQLSKGTLSKNSFDTEWLKSKSINPELLKHKFSIEEIKEALQYLANMFNPAYLPVKKDWLKSMSLNKLIYNPMKQNSWFLSCYTKPPKKLSQASADIANKKDPFPGITNLYKEWANGSFRAEDTAALINKINSIVDFHNSLPQELFADGDAKRIISTPEKLLKHYLEYLMDQRWIDKPSINLLDRRSRVFLNYLNEYWDEGSNYLFKPLSSFVLKEV